MWLYGTGFPKSLDVSKAIDKAAGAEREVVGRRTDRAATPKQDIRDAAREWSGWGTALKPAWEPIILARKPLIGTVAENAAVIVSAARRAATRQSGRKTSACASSRSRAHEPQPHMGISIGLRICARCAARWAQELKEE